MPFWKVTNANIYYEVIGEGIPIMMLHGFSPDHRLMKGCMEPIFNESDGWKRIYIDLPGMGKTKDYENISNSDEMLTTVLEFINTFVPDQPYVIVGESYGGYLARGIMQVHRDRILGTAFICPLILPEKQDRTVPSHSIIAVDQPFLDTLTKQEVDDFSSHQVVLDESNWQRYSNEVLAGCQIADEHFLEKIQQSYGFTFHLEDIIFHQPSLFLLGKQDAVVGYKDAFDVIELFPRATFSILDRAGHNLQIEQSNIFHALVSEWLDRVIESNRSSFL
ncbi:alpha/beta fold hydrolase [Lysinibacillus sp. NPDC093712]|uniref:alpha/beta fold hydrolase n=1 Tax=Lysinibacillus sp. NPDC093712 TaxID=3390579 RepID=UPI003D036F8E